MRIDLYEVLSVTGKDMTVEVKVEERQETFQGEIMNITCKAPFSMVIKHIRKGIVTVEFDTVITVNRICSRCLDNVVSDYALHVLRTVDIAKKEACTDDSGEYDEISYIEDCTLDVDRLVLDELYTVLPMNVLCKEDCKGICKVCGTNLNKSACNCDQRVPDPRMAVFSDIFNQFKEV